VYKYRNDIVSKFQQDRRWNKIKLPPYEPGLKGMDEVKRQVNSNPTYPISFSPMS
jgi:hypothetical protein